MNTKRPRIQRITITFDNLYDIHHSYHGLMGLHQLLADETNCVMVLWPGGGESRLKLTRDGRIGIR